MCDNTVANCFLDGSVYSGLADHLKITLFDQWLVYLNDNINY